MKATVSGKYGTDERLYCGAESLPYFGSKENDGYYGGGYPGWQNSLMKLGYSQLNLKTINNQLSAIFNYAVRLL